MQAVVEFLKTLLNAVLTLGDMGVWLAQGLLSIAGMMTEAIAVFGSVMRLFPFGVASAITAVCGGLIVLRIFGRS